MPRESLTDDLFLKAVKHYAEGTKGPYLVDSLKRSLENTWGADFNDEQFDAVLKRASIQVLGFRLDEKDKGVFHYNPNTTQRRQEGELNEF